MSDTEISGTSGHEWINFGAWVTGDLDEGVERAVEAQFAACDTCWDELEETIAVSAVLYEAAAGGAAVAPESGLSRRATPAGAAASDDVTHGPSN